MDTIREGKNFAERDYKRRKEGEPWHRSPKGMALYLRKVIHPQAHDNYRVILKLDGDEVEVGSIGIQHAGRQRKPRRGCGAQGGASTGRLA